MSRLPTALNLQPELLQGNPPEILQQIYHLRVQAWKDLGVITPDKYPNGWFDELDPTALHWIVKDGSIIVAAARIAIVANFDELPEGQLLNPPGMPLARPIAYISRRVVAPAYQKFGLGEMLLDRRMQYILTSQLPLAIAQSYGANLEKFKKYGFEEIGPVPPQIDPVAAGGSKILYFIPQNIN